LALIELVLEPVNPKAVTKKPKLENTIKAAAGTATAVSEPVVELSEVSDATVEAAAEVAAEAPAETPAAEAPVEEVAAAEEAAGTEETPAAEETPEA
jgi:large subunit ribosomal protein L17